MNKYTIIIKNNGTDDIDILTVTKEQLAPLEWVFENLSCYGDWSYTISEYCCRKDFTIPDTSADKV